MALSYIMSGLQTAGNIFSAIRERRATKDQHNRTKELMDKSHGLQYDMWKKTNYGAQRQELEEAGLNPGLMYGSAGAGGQAVAPSAPQGAKENIFDLGSQIASVRMTEAQTKLAEAQAKKTEVEADKIAGVDTKEAESRIGLNEINKAFKEIETRVSGATEQEQINMINDTADKLLSEAVIARHNQTITENTYKDTENRIKAEALGAVLDNQVKRTQANVNDARVKEISENILQRWEQIEVDKRGQDISKENMEKMVEAMLWGAGIQAGGNLVNNILNIVTKVPTTKK